MNIILAVFLVWYICLVIAMGMMIILIYQDTARK